MSKYVNIDDDNFYEFINRKYAQYKIPKKHRSLKEICFPKKYELQIPQKFLAEFINSKTPYTGILIWHKIGSGKSCSAIHIAEKFKNIKKIMVVVPASLKGNFRSELRSLCAGQNYLTDKERQALKKLHPSEYAYKEIIKKSDARIDKYYTIYSYNKFVGLIKSKNLNLNNTLLIIDEVHNMISETGTYYENLYDVIHSSPNNMRLVIMSATPIFDKPAEISLTMNLLLRDKQMPTGQEFYRTFINTKFTPNGPIYSVKNMDLFKEYIRGYISYYRGAAPKSFPRSEIHIVKCTMSDIQKNLYQKVIKLEAKDDIDDFIGMDIPNNFFIGVRMISNFTYPNKKIGQKGYDSLVERDFDIDRLQKYSPKFVRILRKIRRAPGTVFVYSNFKEYGGIKIFARMLEHYGYKNYEYNGSGRKRYAVFTGDQDLQYKDEIKAVFNNKNNEDGSKIKIILGSSAIKEGISLLRVSQVHIIEPYWNISKLNQIIGRAIRFCSHKDVPYERQEVQVYIYLATHPDIKMTVDQYIMRMAIQKQLINNQFEKALKESAIDCELFKFANIYPGEEDIKCEK